MKNLPLIIMCCECKKLQVREKMMDGELCWNCIGVNNEEQVVSVKCISSEIIKQEKPKNNIPQLTVRKNSVNTYISFNIFNINNLKIEVSYFIDLSLVFIYYLFK